MQEYRFSMNGISLLLPDFIELAKALKDAEFNYDIISNYGIKRDREATRKRELFELKIRLKQLSPNEIQFLTETRIENQKLITFLANIRSYRILREFLEEVVFDKILVFDDQLSYRDFNNFMFNKTLIHKELESVSEIMIKKIRSFIFKMLEQAGLIDSVKSKKIKVPFLDFDMQNLLSHTDQKYLLNV